MKLSKAIIRDVFLSQGFTIKDGETDLKPYVYDAAMKLIATAQVLDAPAQVGNSRFAAGVPWSTVIHAAQRHHTYKQYGAREADRIASATQFVAALNGRPTFEAVWAAYEKKGYQYGADAIENVKFGFDIALDALASAPAPLSDTERKAVTGLIAVARAAFHVADDSEDDGGCIKVDRADAMKLSEALDTLDELPNDHPWYSMGPSNKAEWALRRLIGTPGEPETMEEIHRQERERAPFTLPRDPTLPEGTDPLTEFQEGQWWVKELDALVRKEGTTDDQKRAVAVVHNMLRSVAHATTTVSNEHMAFATWFDERTVQMRMNGQHVNDSLASDAWHERARRANTTMPNAQMRDALRYCLELLEGEHRQILMRDGLASPGLVIAQKKARVALANAPVVGEALGWRVRERRSDAGKLLDCFVEAPATPGMAYAQEVLGDDYAEAQGGIEGKLKHCQMIVAWANAAPQTSIAVADEREAFEAAYAPLFKGGESANMPLRVNGEYVSAQDQIAWIMWRKARATPVSAPMDDGRFRSNVEQLCAYAEGSKSAQIVGTVRRVRAALESTSVPDAQKPIASLHITSTDTYPDIRVEVHDGALLQPSISPVRIYATTETGKTVLGVDQAQSTPSAVGRVEAGENGTVHGLLWKNVAPGALLYTGPATVEPKARAWLYPKALVRPLCRPEEARDVLIDTQMDDYYVGVDGKHVKGIPLGEIRAATQTSTPKKEEE